jgi:myosin-15
VCKKGASMAISSKSDAHDFQSLLTAMKILNFTKNEQETIFKILAAILHLGNIYFSRMIDDPGHDLIQISSKSEVEWCSHLLGLNDQGLLQKLTHKVTEARDERLLSPFNLEQALDSRYISSFKTTINFNFILEMQLLRLFIRHYSVGLSHVSIKS